MNESDWDNEIEEDWDSLDEEDQEEDEAQRKGDRTREVTGREQEGRREATNDGISAEAKTAMEDIDRTMH